MLTMGKSKDNSMKIYSVKDKEFNEFGKEVKIIWNLFFEIAKCVGRKRNGKSEKTEKWKLKTADKISFFGNADTDDVEFVSTKKRRIRHFSYFF